MNFETFLKKNCKGEIYKIIIQVEFESQLFEGEFLLPHGDIINFEAVHKFKKYKKYDINATFDLPIKKATKYMKHHVKYCIDNSYKFKDYKFVRSREYRKYTKVHGSIKKYCSATNFHIYTLCSYTPYDGSKRRLFMVVVMPVVNGVLMRPSEFFELRRVHHNEVAWRKFYEKTSFKNVSAIENIKEYSYHIFEQCHTLLFHKLGIYSQIIPVCVDDLEQITGISYYGDELETNSSNCFSYCSGDTDFTYRCEIYDKGARSIQNGIPEMQIFQDILPKIAADSDSESDQSNPNYIENFSYAYGNSSIGIDHAIESFEVSYKKFAAKTKNQQSFEELRKYRVDWWIKIHVPDAR